MKTKHHHIDHGRLEISRLEKMFKLEIFDGYMAEAPVYSFFIPIIKEKQFWIDELKTIVDFRLKRDYNASIDHFSVMHK